MFRIPSAVFALTLLGWSALAAPPAPPKKPLPPGKTPPPPGDAALPKGSADYSKMLAAATRYKKGEITFEQLKKLVVDERLPPHSLGCVYVISPVPMPPPGVPFDPGIMPPDWVHTFGEVAMTFWVGKITREEYDKLHAAAHGDQPGFPNCGKGK